MRLLLFSLGIAVLTPTVLSAQAASSDSCRSVSLKAPTKWIGWSIGDVEIRTGPGDGYPVHESGELIDDERIQVLQECHGWLQARVIPLHVIDRTIRQYGRTRAQSMLLFWVRKARIRGPQ